VLIEVQYAGVNRPDVLQRSGAYPPPPGASPLLGLEVSGRIAVGDRRFESPLSARTREARTCGFSLFPAQKSEPTAWLATARASHGDRIAPCSRSIGTTAEDEPVVRGRGKGVDPSLSAYCESP
jgi:hypothetical protein